VVVGHSLGGAVAAWLAAQQPQRVAALVLLAPAADTRSLSALDRLLAAPVVGDLLSSAFLAGAGGAVAAPRVRRVIAMRLGVDSRYLRASGRMLLRPETWRSFVAEQRMLIRDLPELERQLNNISSPTTVVGGTADRIVPIACARAVAQQITGARMVELAGAHHLLHQQRPRELADLIVTAARG
jgi:pimeloyl-ACP methyl ester carboxylesterase